MKAILGLIVASLISITPAFAADSKSSGGSSGIMFGPYVGFGLPVMGIAGITIFPTRFLSLDVGLGSTSLKLSDSKSENGVETQSAIEMDLKTSEIVLKWHPFFGAFFIGAGIGKETLTVDGTDKTTNEKVSVEVEANTTLAKVGWMWSAQNGKFWWGMDATYIMPSGADTTIKTDLPTNNETYQDVKKEADEFGETNWMTITFARFGWLF